MDSVLVLCPQGKHGVLAHVPGKQSELIQWINANKDRLWIYDDGIVHLNNGAKVPLADSAIQLTFITLRDGKPLDAYISYEDVPE